MSEFTYAKGAYTGLEVMWGKLHTGSEKIAEPELAYYQQLRTIDMETVSEV
jgi:hypothetical protein